MTSCKIGKIRMKSGGAEIRIFERKTVDNEVTQLLEVLMEKARTGHLKELAYVTINADHSTDRGHSSLENTKEMIGALQCFVNIMAESFNR